jgi:hypothetical protein
MLLLALTVSLAVPTAHAVCLDSVRYGSVYYGGVRLRRPVRLGGSVRGFDPGCNDVAGEPPEPDTPTRLIRIRGIDPRFAVARPASNRYVYVAAGFLPAVPAFPLHDAIYGRSDLPDACGRMPRLDVAIVIRGRLLWPPTPYVPLDLRTALGERFVEVDARTQLGFPATKRIGVGRRLRVVAGRCGRKLVAARIDLR